jgi:hypothetical protein
MLTKYRKRQYREIHTRYEIKYNTCVKEKGMIKKETED